MVNSTEFSDRIQKIIDYYELSASSFADQIGVQRSSISHILSGRNKPSLDFILKTIEAFPEVSLYWLLMNKGDFPSSPEKENELDTEKIKEIKKQDLFTQVENDKTYKNSSLDTAKEKNTEQIPSYKTLSGRTSIERVIIFFKDGSFKEYHN